jgi:uncharacterized protein YybS (DUF2232 family)
VAAWVLVVAVFGVSVAVWGMTLGSIVSPHRIVAIATPEPTFGATRIHVASNGDAASITAAPTCIYTQSDQGLLIVMSTVTGSVLSPAQAANCTN